MVYSTSWTQRKFSFKRLEFEYIVRSERCIHFITESINTKLEDIDAKFGDVDGKFTAVNTKLDDMDTEVKSQLIQVTEGYFTSSF